MQNGTIVIRVISPADVLRNRIIKNELTDVREIQNKTIGTEEIKENMNSNSRDWRKNIIQT